VTASSGLVSRVIFERKLLRELYFLSYCLSEQRQSILNLELIDFAMLHLAAESNELNPCRV
jgi:hypothetical protein